MNAYLPGQINYPGSLSKREEGSFDFSDIFFSFLPFFRMTFEVRSFGEEKRGLLRVTARKHDMTGD